MKTILLFLSATLVFAAHINSNFAASYCKEKVEVSRPAHLKMTNEVPQNGPFYRMNSLNDRVVVTDPIGYFVYDMSVLRADFTDVSYLYLCVLDIDFTPGSAASRNESGFDWHYDFWAADVSLAVPNGLSAAKVKGYWPKSSAITTTLTSEYSRNYTLSFNGQLGLGEATIGGSVGSGYTITYGVSTSSEDPQISAQLLSSEPKKAVWNVRCTVQRGITYNLSCYYLLEMPKSYSEIFLFMSTMDMTCIAWRGFLWEQKKHLTAFENLCAN